MALADDSDTFKSTGGSAAVAGSRYEIVRELGHGGMATVFLAKDSLLERELAIKVLNAELALDQLQVERFRNEAQSCSALDHPNIVKVLSHGENAVGRPFIVMEYLQGKTLEDAFKNKEMTGREFLDQVVLPVIDALIYAHDRRIVHRDLKPSNIMICRAPGEELVVKVLDFGIAKALERDTNTAAAAATVGFMGSPLYMSPEQAAGAKADPRSDIYSLACIMYEALAGRPPFVGETPLETMYEHLRASIPKLDGVQTANQISDELVELITKCLAKDPEQRPSSMSSVREMLQHSLSSTKVTRRKSVAPLLVAIIIAVCLLGAAAFLFLQLKSRRNAESRADIVTPTHMIVAGGRSANALYSRAKTLIKARKYEEAIPLLQTSLRELSRSDSASELQAEIHEHLANAYDGIGAKSKALPEYKAVVDSYSASDAYGKRLDAIVTYARNLSQQGYMDETEKLYKATLKEAQKVFGNTTVAVFGDFLYGYATFLFRDLKRPPEECLRLARQAMFQFDGAGHRFSGHSCDDTWLLYDIYQALGQTEKGKADVAKTAKALGDLESNSSRRICIFADEANKRKLFDVAEKIYLLALDKASGTAITGEIGEGEKVRERCRAGLKNIALVRKEFAVSK